MVGCDGQIALIFQALDDVKVRPESKKEFVK